MQFYIWQKTKQTHIYLQKYATSWRYIAITLYCIRTNTTGLLNAWI